MYQSKRRSLFNLTSIVSIVGLITLVCMYGCSSPPKGPVLGQDSLGNTPILPSPTPQDVVLSEPNATPTPKSTPVAKTVGVTFVPDEYYTTADQRVMIKKAEKKLNEVIQSKCFYDFISNRKLIQTNGRTPKQVADHIQSLSGKIPVQMYSPGRFSSAVAYRQPPDLTIHLSYYEYTPKSRVCDWVSVMAHESLGHSLGEYDHDYRWSSSREYSVPYSINHAIDKDSYSGSASAHCCIEDGEAA